MKLSRNRGGAARRGGYTLIELLVVISIIALLVSLTAAAVIRALAVGPKTANRSEIGQLDGSVQAFTGDGGYKMAYLPSRIILRKYYGDYFVGGIPNNGFLTALDSDSVTYITTMFKSSGQKLIPYWTVNGIAWQTAWASAAYKPGGLGSELLEGDQCLVFFLGGIQTTANGVNGCLGFSNNAAQPDNIIGDTKSFYEFKSNRLFARPGKTFFSYADAYGSGVPFAYFSAYGKDNNYNRYDKNNNYAVWLPSGVSTATSDCVSLGLWPYAESSQVLGSPPTTRVNYLKKSTYQIVSAGKDGVFGLGTDVSGATTPAYFWTLATAGNISVAGSDDQANFAPGILKSGPQ